MSFFETLNEKFFNPFCCRNRVIYFECISELIEKSKEISVLYETDARNTLILYLQNCTYAIETENIGEEIAGGKTPQENASTILRYFRVCGWITPQEIGRNGDNIASVSAYCRRLIDAVHKIFDGDANGAITNHIFSMYEILKSSFNKDSGRSLRPYQNILLPLVENECDLKNEILILKDSIREIMRAVMKMADANSFGQFLMKDELLNRFFNDYFFIKKSGLIPSYISDIDRMLRKLRRSELYDRMIQEYTKIEHADKGRAREKIDRLFHELDSFINLEYEQEMSYIDRRINNYYNLYSTRMMMVLSENGNLEHELNRVLMHLQKLDGEKREEAVLRLSESHRLMSMGYIGRKSFERRKKRNPNQKNVGLVSEELSEEERKRLTDELLTETPDRYSMDNVEKHFDELLKGRDQLSVEECQVHTRDDATMIAASMIYSGTAGFPYEVEFWEGMVETEVARISNIRIKRKK
ncbi:MAG TPA: chromosome segregation protein SMC [Candidatus Eisenbergiella stercoravium]|nr:chromosome segregation protein SMC [Candidatus Eisenbergiella stercoravium]